MSPVKAIKEIMPKMGVKVVDNTSAYDKARNDPHVTVEGNEAMAEDIYKFLMTNYESTFRNYREERAMPHPRN